MPKTKTKKKWKPNWKSPIIKELGDLFLFSEGRLTKQKIIETVGEDIYKNLKDYGFIVEVKSSKNPDVMKTTMRFRKGYNTYIDPTAKWSGTGSTNHSKGMAMIYSLLPSTVKKDRRIECENKLKEELKKLKEDKITKMKYREMGQKYNKEVYNARLEFRQFMKEVAPEANYNAYIIAENEYLNTKRSLDAKFKSKTKTKAYLNALEKINKTFEEKRNLTFNTGDLVKDNKIKAAYDKMTDTLRSIEFKKNVLKDNRGISPTDLRVTFTAAELNQFISNLEKESAHVPSKKGWAVSDFRNSISKLKSISSSLKKGKTVSIGIEVTTEYYENRDRLSKAHYETLTGTKVIFLPAYY